MNATQQWNATHQITWTPTGLEPEVIDVMEYDGSLYTREEWEAAEPAYWMIDQDRRIYFREGVAPGNGSIEIRRVEDDNARVYPERCEALSDRLFLGSAILNGPGGAEDTPECYVPSPYDPSQGLATAAALLIRAKSPGDAQRKQTIWHALMARACDLESEERPVELPEYRARKKEAIAMLRGLADEIVGT